MANRLGIEEATGAQGTKDPPSIWMLSCDWRLHLAIHCSCYELQMFLLQPRCCGCGFHHHCLRPHQGQEQQSPFSYIFSCQCLSQATSTGNSWRESFGKCRAVPSPLHCSQNAIPRIHGTVAEMVASPSMKPTQFPCTRGPSG